MKKKAYGLLRFRLRVSLRIYLKTTQPISWKCSSTTTLNSLNNFFVITISNLISGIPLSAIYYPISTNRGFHKKLNPMSKKSSIRYSITLSSLLIRKTIPAKTSMRNYARRKNPKLFFVCSMKIM